MQRLFDMRKGGMLRSLALSLSFSTLFIAVSVGAATTISTNVNTGGTLTVTGASTLNGAVTLGDAAGDAIIITGNASTSNSFEVNNDLYVNGYATTTGASGNFATAGTLTVVGTVYASSTSLFTGALTTYGAVTLGDAAGDAIIITGNASTSNSFEVNNDLYVNGYATTTGASGNFATAGTLTVVGTVYASSTSLFTGAVTTYGDVTVGDAQGDTLTINAGTISHGNAATTTIPASSVTSWNIATSSALVPFVRFDTSNYRIGIGGTTTPGDTLSVQGSGLFTGNLDVQGTFSPTQTSATAFTVDTTLTVTGRADLNGQASTTRLSAFDRIYVGGTATSTLRGDNVASTLPYASSTAITTTGGSWFATDGGGNRVGIGTTTPGATFSVHGDGLVSGTLSVAALAATSSSITLSGLGTDLLTSISNSGVLVSTSTPTAAYYLATSSIASSFRYASTTSFSATVASTTNLSLGAGSTLQGMIFGTCDLTQVQIAATTTQGVPCTSNPTTGITTGFLKVFVSATSSIATTTGSTLYGGFSISGASTTGTNLIGVQVTNLTGDIRNVVGTLNYWAVR